MGAPNQVIHSAAALKVVLAHHDTGLTHNEIPANRSFAAERIQMPLRSLVILIAIALVIYAVRSLWRTSRPADRRGQESARMVQCAHCGIYVPEREALTSGGRFYCSAAHLKDDTGAGG